MKKMMIPIALLVSVSAVLMACGGKAIIEPVSDVEPAPVMTFNLSASDSLL